MVFHLLPERLIFTVIATIGFIQQCAFLVAAFSDSEYLTRIGASPMLRIMIGPHWEGELARLTIMFLVLALGLASFFTPITPHTLFGDIAIVVIILMVLEIEFVSLRDFQRRRYLLADKDAKREAANVTKVKRGDQ